MTNRFKSYSWEVDTINEYSDDIQSILENNNILDEANNVSSTRIQNNYLEHQQTNVVQIEQQVKSVAMYTRDIEMIRSICESVEEPKAPCADIWLAIASLFAGAFLSAIVAGEPLENTCRSIIAYVFSPAITTGCGTAFFFTRKKNQIAAKDLANHVLEYLPQIDNVSLEGPDAHES